ncbi:MAG: exodeoxyribonuclease VII large subunit [Tannerella sp.]|jgi:exodeoxyribonuclease VII large subunit|nr:exodeoxyribonuclease VII large subunit [Tannerella sp.]
MLEDTREALSLLELAGRIKGVVDHAFPDSYWLRAETSDVRQNLSSGHCYLEFIEKSPLNGQIVAKMRASIWARNFRMLKPFFERETGQAFASGLKVLVKVSVNYHELYGFSLTVLDIDPAYTMGDMLRRRLEIIRRLKEEGVFNLNKELPFPALPQRIALITSPTAAGYGDFIAQLADNRDGYVFYPKLFPALMQGDKVEASLTAALDRIFPLAEHFDLVVIIRGGGATSELSCFDSYPLAAACAQFPLPILTGIGHERDDTVLDLVAHKRLKTPTAVAEYLISCMDAVAAEVDDLQEGILTRLNGRLQEEKNRLQLLGLRLPRAVGTRMERNRSLLTTWTNRLPASAMKTVERERNRMERAQNVLQSTVQNQLLAKENFLKLTAQFIRMASPDYILRRGYSLTLRKGKIIKKAADLKAGDEITTRFSDGTVHSQVSTESQGSLF